MKSKIYQAVFKNVPLPLMDELRKYAKHQGVYSTRWKMRKPIPGQKYGWGGALKRENATAADLYVDMTKYHLYKKVCEENRELSSWNTDLVKENHAHKEKIASQLRACQEYAVELEKLRRVVMALDRRQGGERRST